VVAAVAARFAHANTVYDRVVNGVDQAHNIVLNKAVALAAPKNATA
jgi:hypothetical protein